MCKCTWLSRKGWNLSSRDRTADAERFRSPFTPSYFLSGVALEIRIGNTQELFTIYVYFHFNFIWLAICSATSDPEQVSSNFNQTLTESMVTVMEGVGVG